jgi:hypothetical protein
MRALAILGWLWVLGQGQALRASLLDTREGVRNTNPLMKPSKPKSFDKNELKATVDASQVLFDALAHETRGLSVSARLRVLQSLKEDYHLEAQLAACRSALEYAEQVLQAQQDIKAQLQALVAASDGAASRDAQARMDELHDAQAKATDDLRSGLRSLHKSLSEEQTRDLRNWLSVSGGLLKQRREQAARDALAGLTPTPEAIPSPQPTPTLQIRYLGGKGRR